ncbi:MAG: tetratricopeptide repeat protein, partial [Deltaproteobacteria bacterium]|nr:tetratricopeptide repeat protein [Deltaproteobacteria bacterium]
GAQPAASPFGAQPAASPFGAQPAASPFGAPPAASPFGAPPAASPFGAQPAASPFSAPPAASPFGAPPLGDAGPSPFGPPMGEPAAGMPQIGFAQPAAAPVVAPKPAATSDPSMLWRIRQPGGQVLESMTTEEVKEKIRSGVIKLDAEAALGDQDFTPIEEKRIFGATLRAAGGGKSDRSLARGASVRQRSHAPVMVLGFLAIATTVALLLFLFKPSWIPSFGGGGGRNAFLSQASLWRLQFPDVEGTSEEHLRKGRKLYLDDNAQAYRLADEELRKAILLDPENLDAIAAFVENLARMPNLKQRTEDVQAALDGIDYAIKRDPNRASLFRAKGALLLGLQSVQKAQSELYAAQRLSPDDAETALWMAESDVGRNSPQAIKAALQARSRDSKLKRTDLVLGRARFDLGEFHQAMDDFNRRLKIDPDHVETLFEVARLDVQIGAYDEAVATLTRILAIDDYNSAIRLYLAKVYYQSLGDVKNADLQLTVAVEAIDKEEEPGEEARDVYTHLSYVRARRDKWDEAEALAKKALELDSAYAPAHFALGQALLHRGDRAEALKHFERALQATSESYLEAPVRTAVADTKIGLNRLNDAVRDYERALESDPRHLRAYMGLAAGRLRLDDAANMAMAMRCLIDVDPENARIRVYFTDYPQDQRDLAGYLKAFDEYKGSPDDASILKSSMGIIAYHLGELAAAEGHLRRALHDDSKNASALLYLGALQLRRNNAGAAIETLTRAVEVNQLHVVTRYTLGRALYAAGRLDAAGAKLEDLHSSDPTFLPAVCLLADLLRQRGEVPKAKELYLSAFKVDVDLLPAKRGLFLSGS